ncbi:MAG: GNAT family N-acetyltransferase [Myxococcales bacterium]|nr:GNAT family N-acetyltransferase [Myxococcales bacterium]
MSLRMRATIHSFDIAEPGDLEAIADLINLAYLVERYFLLGPRIDEEGVAVHIRAREMLIVRGEAEAIATAHLRVAGPNAHLGLVSVRPEAQGQGLGRRIVGAAEDLATERGAQWMHLQVVHLRSELPEFYRNLGYQETGTSAFDESKAPLQPVHFIDMAKSLVGHE